MAKIINLPQVEEEITIISPLPKGFSIAPEKLSEKLVNLRIKEVNGQKSQSDPHKPLKLQYRNIEGIWQI